MSAETGPGGSAPITMETLFEKGSGRFRPLKKHLFALMIEDLPFLDNEDFERMIAELPSEDRLIARVFVRTELQPLQQKVAMAGEAQAALSSFERLDPAPFHRWLPEVATLSFSRRLDPTQATAFSASHLSCGFLPDYVREQLSEIRSQVCVLDLSFCNLQSADLEYVFQAVIQFPMLHTLNLSSNLLRSQNSYESPKFVLAMLNFFGLKMLQYIDITFNPAASAENVDYFRNVISASHLDRLVWLPSSFFFSPDAVWKRLVTPRGQGKDDPALKAVLRVHTAYYSLSFANLKTKVIHGSATHEVREGMSLHTLIEDPEKAAAMVRDEGFKLCTSQHCRNRFSSLLLKLSVDDGFVSVFSTD